MQVYDILERQRMVAFGKHLASLRKTRKLTQSQLADLLGVQPKIVSRWEQGEVKPQFDYIVRLSEALEVSIDHLMTGKEFELKDDFVIQNRRLKDLCVQVDHELGGQDQDVICYMMDSLIRKEIIKKAIN